MQSKKYGISRRASINSGGIFDVAARLEQIAQFEQETTVEGFWNDAEQAKKTLKQIKDGKRVVDSWEEVNRECGDIGELYELAVEEGDLETLAELGEQVAGLEGRVARLEFIRKLGGEDDLCDAILTIHSGAGGTESCDWAEMLFRMYTRWMERKGYEYVVSDYLPGEEAGIKQATIEVRGEYAFGYLKAESGVHRLVRISPFDSNARRHTSFASVYACPVLEEIEEYEIDEDDLRVDTYRSSGAGGQHINKTDSAVRITHVPTNIVTQCQSERSQIKNRASAMRMLKARVRQHYKEIEEQQRQDKMTEKKKIEWGSQIRSYVLHPYNLVKDLRTDAQTSNTQAVLDGDIDLFIESYLLAFV